MQKQNHILLSRKYRPTNFASLRGQDILVESLSYAILNNRLAQSYLLTGIRGIGKTTSARIIAKTINCTNLKTENKIPATCNECSNCKSCSNGSHPDIIEIDAASRTGVDDIRHIIENAEYKPLQAQYKVFIIDEVHMLSKSAFNALLKLLEEPPAHCLFIFATTEVHKIPLTIISRCQRFDLVRFAQGELEKLLSEICGFESINASPEALSILCVKADGSARDALSLLDQARILSEDKEITQKIVNQMVSAVEQSLIIEFLEKIVEQNADAAFKILENFYKTSTNFTVFISDFLSLCGYLAKKMAIPNYSSSHFYSYEDRILAIESKIDMHFIQIAWQLSYKAQTELKNSLNQLEHLEMVVLKIIYLLSKKNNDFTKTNNPKINQAQETKEIFELKASDAKQENYNYDGFLKFLNQNSEIDLYYTLFNKSEISYAENNLWLIKIAKSNSKIDNELKAQIMIWGGGKIQVKIEYSDNITPHKESIKKEISENQAFQNLAKNFADVQITDILMRSN